MDVTETQSLEADRRVHSGRGVYRKARYVLCDRFEWISCQATISASRTIIEGKWPLLEATTIHAVSLFRVICMRIAAGIRFRIDLQQFHFKDQCIVGADITCRTT